MYANNRSGVRGMASFRNAGGSIYLFSHPFLLGQSDGDSTISALGKSTVNVSKSLRLSDTFFNAQALQDSAIMEVLVDGSTITITNHLMAGRATLQVLSTTGLVRDGDLTAIAPFIMSAKDNVGGLLTRRRFVKDGVLTRVYYGVTFANFPHDIDAGNAAPVYSITMLYSGWFEGLTTSGTSNERLLWAVGNSNAIKGNFEANVKHYPLKPEFF